MKKSNTFIFLLFIIFFSHPIFLLAQNHIKWMSDFYSKLVKAEDLELGMNYSYYTNEEEKDPSYKMKIRLYKKAKCFRTEIEDKTGIFTPDEFISIIFNEKMIIFGKVKKNNQPDPLKEIFKYDSILKEIQPSMIIPEGDHIVCLLFLNPKGVPGSIKVRIDTIIGVISRIEIIQSQKGVNTKTEIAYTKFDTKPLLSDDLFNFNNYLYREGNVIRPTGRYSHYRLVQL